MSLISCLFVLKHIAIQEVIDGNERYQLYVLANKLRQSSDDLTELARLYVITGEKKYRDYYNETLSIRNGSAPFPPITMNCTGILLWVINLPIHSSRQNH